MKTKVWIARNEDGVLFIYSKKPCKYENMFVPSSCIGDVFELDHNSHPEITWENSPQQIEI